MKMINRILDIEYGIWEMEAAMRRGTEVSGKREGAGGRQRVKMKMNNRILDMGYGGTSMKMKKAADCRLQPNRLLVVSAGVSVLRKK